MKKINVEVSEEFDRQLRIKAALLDMNRPQLIRKILTRLRLRPTSCTDAEAQPTKRLRLWERAGCGITAPRLDRQAVSWP